MNTMIIRRAAILSAFGVALSGCAGWSDAQKGTAIGAATGGAAGAVLGGGVLGTVGGAAVGGVIGHEVGENRDEKKER